ncbi:MAG: MGMT family protein [Leptospiraceae bacterium]|nr:MGMT family protein [Leptospiraceae bacterium]
MGAMIEMKKDVLLVVNAVPSGRVVTYGSIAQFLGISPRHVAFILAGLNAQEARTVPWHRVVSAGGWLNRDRKMGDGRQQFELEKEGVTVKNQRLDLQSYQVAIEGLPSGLKGGRIYRQA